MPDRNLLPLLACQFLRDPDASVGSEVTCKADTPAAEINLPQINAEIRKPERLGYGLGERRGGATAREGQGLLLKITLLAPAELGHGLAKKKQGEDIRLLQRWDAL